MILAKYIIILLITYATIIRPDFAKSNDFIGGLDIGPYWAYFDSKPKLVLSNDLGNYETDLTSMNLKFGYKFKRIMTYFKFECAGPSGINEAEKEPHNQFYLCILSYLLSPRIYQAERFNLNISSGYMYNYLKIKPSNNSNPKYIYKDKSMIIGMKSRIFIKRYNSGSQLITDLSFNYSFIEYKMWILSVAIGFNDFIDETYPRLIFKFIKQKSNFKMYSLTLGIYVP